MCNKNPADAEMGFGASLLGDQRICRLLHPVVSEPVDAWLALNELCSDRFPKGRMDLVLRGPERVRKLRDVGGGAKAGELPQRHLGSLRKADELADHEVDDVVRMALVPDSIEIPGPALNLMIESQQSLVGQRVKELQDEERIAGCFGLQQF